MSDVVAAVRQPQETEKTTSIALVSTPYASQSQPVRGRAWGCSSGYQGSGTAAVRRCTACVRDPLSAFSGLPAVLPRRVPLQRGRGDDVQGHALRRDRRRQSVQLAQLVVRLTGREQRGRLGVVH